MIRPTTGDENQESDFEEALSRCEVHRMVKDCRHLTTQEKAILAVRYGLGTGHHSLPRRRIAEDLGLSDERIRQIEISALYRLRTLSLGITYRQQQERWQQARREGRDYGPGINMGWGGPQNRTRVGATGR